MPYAHVFEQWLFHSSTYSGQKVGFYRGDPLKIVDDVALLKPTFFVSVPRLYNRIYDKLNAKLRDLKGPKKWMAQRGMGSKTKRFNSNGSSNHWFWDKLVFNKFKNALGGHVKFMITGAAPIADEVRDFMAITFSVPLIQGFGQTENSAPCCATHPQDPTSGHVGGPETNMELRLEDVAEMNYTHKDVDEAGNPMPRGELLTRGPLIFKGYYKMEQ